MLYDNDISVNVQWEELCNRDMDQLLINYNHTITYLINVACVIMVEFPIARG